MKLRKIIGLVVVGIMLMGTVWGCGNNTTKEDKTTRAGKDEKSADSDATESASTGEDDTEITLTAVRTLDSTVKFDTTNPDRTSLTENIWQRAYKEKLGINIEYLWTPNTEQYNQKWNVAIASGNLPDMGVVEAAMYKQLVEADLVEDMTDIYNEYASDLYKQANQAEDYATISYMTFDGRMLGLPRTGIQPDSATMMFIRQDWLDQVNMEIPTTIDELVAVAKAFQKAELGGKDTVGIAASNAIQAGINGLKGITDGYYAYHDIWVDDGEGNLVFGSTTSEMREAALKLQEMYADGLFRQEFATLDSAQSGEDVVSGKCGITFGTFWAPLNSIGDNIKNDETADWVVCNLPTVDGEPFYSSTSVIPSEYIFVKKGCKNPEAVVEVLNLGYELYASGDKNYNTDDEGFESFKYRFSPNSDVPWKNLQCQQGIEEVLQTGDSSNLSASDQNAYEQVLAGLDGNRVNIPNVLVFGPDSTFNLIDDLYTEDRIVINAYQALPTDAMTEKGTDLTINLDAAIFKVIMGDDISVFDKAVESWKSSGGNEITQEVNAWYSGQAN